MRSRTLMVTVVAAVAALVGCEWTGSDSGSFSWNDNYDVVNFSGTYRGANGSAVARSTKAIPVVGDTTVTSRNASEQVAIGNGMTSNFAGTLSKYPVVVGSVAIFAEGVGGFSDNGAGRLVDSADIPRGTITYASGAWSLDTPIDLSPTQKITATFTYEVTTSGGSNDPIVVQTITVSQTGQYLTMNASNGMVFTGQISGMNVPETVTADAVIVGKFSVSSGSEKIVGTLSDFPEFRTLDGSWVRGRETLDISGYANPATRRNAP